MQSLLRSTTFLVADLLAMKFGLLVIVWSNFFFLIFGVLYSTKKALHL